MSELYTLPDGWEWKKLDDFVSIKGGKRIPKGKKLLETKTNYPYIRVTDFTDFGSIDLNNIQYITEDIYNEIKNYIISKDDIYISIAGTIGKTGIIQNELDGANLTENAAKLVFDNSKYDKYFLLYFTNSIPFLEQIGLATKTVAMPKLALTRLKEVEIPLPPLEEQKRIVAKLDNLFAKIDKAIALHQKNIYESNVFMASVLNDVFVELEEKYEKFNINKIAAIKGGKRVPKGYKLSEEATPYPYLRVTDFKDYGTICTKKMLYLTEEVYEQIKRYTITDDDLYITNVGNTIGKSGIIPSELNGANLTENAVKLVYKDKKNTSNKFMYYFTKTSIFLIQLESATMQMAVPKLAIMRLGEIELPFPPINTQQKVVSYLDEISKKMEKIKQIQKEKMQSLKALKASILDQAFKGEL